MTNTEMPELRIGMLVFTSDGDELGRVKEIDAAECFKVDAPMALDFWLDRGSVASTELEVVRLKLPKDHFNQNNTLDIDHKGLHSHPL